MEKKTEEDFAHNIQSFQDSLRTSQPPQNTCCFYHVLSLAWVLSGILHDVSDIWTYARSGKNGN